MVFFRTKDGLLRYGTQEVTDKNRLPTVLITEFNNFQKRKITNLLNAPIGIENVADVVNIDIVVNGAKVEVGTKEEK